VISAIHQRFSATFTPNLLSLLEQSLAPPAKQALANLPQDQREKEESSRVIRQRPLLRLSAELAMVGVWRDAPDRSGGEIILKIVKDLVRMPFVNTSSGSNTLFLLVSQ
jgi:regulator of nonsense transcripts 2